MASRVLPRVAEAMMVEQHAETAQPTVPRAEPHSAEKKVPLAPPVVPHPILSPIEQSVRLPTGVTGEGAFKVVTCHLSRRMTRGEARHFFTALPADLRQLVDECLVGRGEAPERFGKNEYLERVARDLKMEGNLGEAERVARAVFRQVEEHIPAAVFRHVMSQLPGELSDIWALP